MRTRGPLVTSTAPKMGLQKKWDWQQFKKEAQGKDKAAKKVSTAKMPRPQAKKRREMPADEPLHPFK